MQHAEEQCDPSSCRFFIFPLNSLPQTASLPYFTRRFKCVAQQHAVFSLRSAATHKQMELAGSLRAKGVRNCLFAPLQLIESQQCFRVGIILHCAPKRITLRLCLFLNNEFHRRWLQFDLIQCLYWLFRANTLEMIMKDGKSCTLSVENGERKTFIAAPKNAPCSSPNKGAFSAEYSICSCLLSARRRA